MTFVGVGFSLYMATGYLSDANQRRTTRITSTMSLQGQAFLKTWNEGGEGALRPQLEAYSRDFTTEVWLFEGGQLRIGTAEIDPELKAFLKEAKPEGVYRRFKDGDRFAQILREADTTHPDLVFLSQSIRKTPLEHAFEREQKRLILIVFVAGLLSYLLARFIARPISHIRKAASQIAEGDLSARVMPNLKGTSKELVELAQDFDRMAERLEAIVESQNRLLRDVSHELRSPLARLHVALELARKKAGEGAASTLDRIERDALRLGELISEILQLTRLDAGVVAESDEEKVLDVSLLTEQITADVDFEAKGHKRSVLSEIEGALMLKGHQELLRRALENIMRNALRFTPEGSSVDVELKSFHDAGKPWMRLWVRDHGPGVPEESLKDIFRPFYRVENARSRDTGGAGIGLAIVDRAVRIHRGRVWAENAQDGGLKVCIELPLRTDVP